MFYEKFLNYLYPNVCGICEKRIFSNSYTCINCLSILKCYRERIIINSNNFFDYMLNMYEYTGIIKKQIYKFKFKENKYIKNTFAELITQKVIKLKLKFDIIIPVPISYYRYLERGYNQCEEISKLIGKFLNKNVGLNILIKSKNNKKQSTLHVNERKKNVLGVYNIKHQERIKNKIVLLIDDIYTTGATINECAKMLKIFGAKKVLVITIAYAKKNL